MRIQRNITRAIALSLAILVGVGTTPLSAAEVNTPSNIGSVSAVGSVQLRGVGVTEGTLFSGDRLNVGIGAYARVVLNTGSRVEIDGNSNVKVSKDADVINIQMTSGNIGFSGSQKPVRIQVGSFVVTPNSQARGSVAFVGTETFGVRVLEGSVTVRNTATKQSSTVTKGTERLISLRDSNTDGVLLASASPTAIPAVPSMPAARQTSGGKKTALLIGAVLGSTAAIAVLMTKNDDSDSEAAARLQRTTLAQNLANAAVTAQQVETAATQVSAAATNVNTAIANSNVPAGTKATLQAAANALISKASATREQITGLEAQLDELFSRLLPTTDIQTVLSITDLMNQVVARINDEVAKLNEAIVDLNSLLQSARDAGVQGVPNTVIQQIPSIEVPSPTEP